MASLHKVLRYRGFFISASDSAVMFYDACFDWSDGFPHILFIARACNEINHVRCIACGELFNGELFIGYSASERVGLFR